MNGWERLFTLFVIFVVAWLSFMVTMSMLANGRTQYCYVEYQVVQDVPVYRLYAFRNWRQDRLVKASTSFEDARGAAQAIGCTIR